MQKGSNCSLHKKSISKILRTSLTNPTQNEQCVKETAKKLYGMFQVSIYRPIHATAGLKAK